MPTSEVKVSYLKYLLIAAGLFFLLPKPTVEADVFIPPSTPPIVQPMDARAIALGTFFEKYNCPLLPYVDDFIAAADKYSMDFRLLPSIALHESTCGKHYPLNTNNPFGWLNRDGTVHKFDSLPSAIDFITGQLQNGSPYANKNIKQKLATYCPTPGYAEQTVGYMNQIN